jgi:hypothetical protein
MAQGTPAAGPGQPDGLQSAYGRIYMLDVESMMATAGAGDSLDPASTPLIGRVAVFTFEDAAAAEEGIGQLSDMTAGDAFEGADAGKEEIDDLGDTAYQYTGEVEVEAGLTANMTLLIVQDDAQILMAAVVGGADPDAMARSWVEFMLDAEIGDDEARLVDDGTSTGGAFDLMPGADDEDLLQGLLPIADLDLLAEGL